MELRDPLVESERKRPTSRAGEANESDTESFRAVADVFALLSDETRLRIVRELWRRRCTHPADPALSFSELRTRVGTRDGGRFNYHLNQLRDSLVEKQTDGYVLTQTGVAVVTRLIEVVLESRTNAPTD